MPTTSLGVDAGRARRAAGTAVAQHLDVVVGVLQRPLRRERAPEAGSVALDHAVRVLVHGRAELRAVARRARPRRAPTACRSRRRPRTRTGHGSAPGRSAARRARRYSSTTISVSSSTEVSDGRLVERDLAVLDQVDAVAGLQDVDVVVSDHDDRDPALLACRRATRSRIIAPSLAPIAASGSSSRRMSASECTVRATAIAWRWPPDSRATGTSSRGMLTPISSSASRVSRCASRGWPGTAAGCGPARGAGTCCGRPTARRRARGPGRRSRSRASARGRPTVQLVLLAVERASAPRRASGSPQMILISVDLPAPLSPSRPSTSPLRRCRLTSRSAVTGPKRLATCSTRRTSSAARRSSSPAVSHAAPFRTRPT